VTITSLRIGTWNILCRRNHWTNRTADAGAVQAILVRHQVDVLSLQEIHYYDGEPDPVLINELRDAGLEHFVGEALSESHLDKSAQLGVGVASRHPLSDQDSVRLTRPNLQASVRGQLWVLHNKGMVGCAVDVGGRDPLRVYSLHLFPFFEFGVGDDHPLVERMWREFWGHADRLAEGDLVLAGDFNQQQREPAAVRWSSRQWSFCFGSKRTTSNGHSLDEIALSWLPTGTKTELVPTFSDHCLAVADVQLSRGNAGSAPAGRSKAGRASVRAAAGQLGRFGP
jgi:endonuclease/exonuclease/phosphatase family metal-dependent hydrolase